MHYSIALLGLVAAAYGNPVSYTGASIPACGWTTTMITEAGATDTVPIPLASADCSSMPASPAAPAPSSMVMECSEYEDGQPQCSMVPVAPCTEIVDGQPQCPTSVPAPAPVAPCTEIVDGQPQCPTSTPAPAPVAPCTEIVDGQPQCPTSTPVAPCTEIVDGQPQCPVSSAAPTGYYPTGGTGYAMPTGTGGYVAPSSYGGPVATGAAVVNGPAAGLLAAAGFAVAMM